MTHKVHPKAYRIRRINDWDSRGYYKDPAKYLEEDFKIRKFLRKKLEKVGIERIEIERFPNKLNIIISSARPGLIIGRGGEGIEELKKELKKTIKIDSRKWNISEFLEDKRKKKTKIKTITEPLSEKRKSENVASSKLSKASLASAGDKSYDPEIRIEIREIKDPWTSASLSAQWIAYRIEKRIHHRRVLKQALSKIMAHKEIKGARVEISGRLNGAEISRREWLKEGQLPLQTIRADIDYAKARAYCTYGVVGIKVWIYKGEKFE